MNFDVLPNGNLLITTDNRDREELAALLRDGRRDCAECEVAEAARWAKNYEFVTGTDLCALSDAPFIAEGMSSEDDGSKTFYGKVWKYEEYCLRDYLEELAWKGRTVFMLGAEFPEDEPYRVPSHWLDPKAYGELSVYNFEHCLD
jgi:hypothetical protein